MKKNKEYSVGKCVGNIVKRYNGVVKLKEKKIERIKYINKEKEMYEN